MYLSVKQVADRLGVCTKTVYRMIEDGKLPSKKLSPRCVRIAESDLVKFMEG